MAHRPPGQMTLAARTSQTVGHIVALNIVPTPGLKTSMQKSGALVPRTCAVCSDEFLVTTNDPIIVRPCRICDSEWCSECLVEIFTWAADGIDRMPPRCCAMIQLHTIISRLSHQTVVSYRANLAEYIAREKYYCPSNTCSAHIPEILVPSRTSATGPKSLNEILSWVITKTRLAPASRFFRDATLQESLPGYNDIIHTPTDLDTIDKLVDASAFNDSVQFMETLTLLETNAVKYNSSAAHPVAQAAKEVVKVAQAELNRMVDRLIAMMHSTSHSKQQLFACPVCHIAICAKCRQIHHQGDCNESMDDHTEAMLLSFGYKRCPRCKHGLKKMYGCSHMACVCGAHFCWHCLRSRIECQGGCAESLDRESSDGEEDDEINEGLAIGSPAVTAQGAVSAAVNAHTPGAMVVSAANAGLSGNAQITQTTLDDASQLPRNLDAGGDRRWAATDFDFGNEPEEPERIVQPWSCPHRFCLYEANTDGWYHGDLKLMECNRCNLHIELYPIVKGVARVKGWRAKLATTCGPGTSFECNSCYLLVCTRCRDFYEEEARERKRL